MAVPVHVPTPLRSYTQERGRVEADGATLGAVLDDLERRFPGMRFRMIDEQDQVRRHIKLFVNDRDVNDLARPIVVGDEVTIICALSGGRR